MLLVTWHHDNYSCQKICLYVVQSTKGCVNLNTIFFYMLNVCKHIYPGFHLKFKYKLTISLDWKTKKIHSFIWKIEWFCKLNVCWQNNNLCFICTFTLEWNCNTYLYFKEPHLMAASKFLNIWRKRVGLFNVVTRSWRWQQILLS